MSKQFYFEATTTKKEKPGLATRLVKNQRYRIHILKWIPIGREHVIPNMDDHMVTNTALNKQLSSSICPCRKIWKNIRNLKVDWAGIKCQVDKTQM